MVVSLNVDHCDLCFFIQTSHVFKGAFERATELASFAEKILSAVDWSAFGEEEDLSEDEGVWRRPVLLDVIFVRDFPELMTVRGGHQKSSVIQAPDGRCQLRALCLWGPPGPGMAYKEMLPV